ncbi:MAG: Grx4 family monothiol glutaredoxin [bacterium]|nr:Grx4 family monothiol glutaredoxin [bacterium]
MALNTELKNQIETIIASDKIILFMKGTKENPQCGFSATVVEILNQLVPEYTTVNVLADHDIREGIKEFSAWPTIPQLYAHKEFIGGCDIIKELYSNGEIFEALKIPKPSNKIPHINITPNAADAFLKALQDAGPEDKLRLKVNINFGHDLSFSSKNANDLEIKSAGLSILIDPISAAKADGLTIDYASNKMGAGFEINNPNAPSVVKDMTVVELKQKLDNHEKFNFFDVRTQEEWDLSRIPGAKLFLELTEDEIAALDKNTPIVFQCRSGGRSARTAEQFNAKGFRNVYNLKGGILAYKKEIDDSIVAS